MKMKANIFITIWSFLGFTVFMVNSDDLNLTDLDEINANEIDNRIPNTVDTYGWILNTQGKNAIKNIIKQMPCGWPEYGIPPLAPYTNGELKVRLVKYVLDSLIQMTQFKLEGLDDVDIKKLHVSYMFDKNVKFHLNFKHLKTTATTFETDTLIDAMQQLGLKIRYEGQGPLEFNLHNLSIRGSFKYKMPIFFGSIKIYKFKSFVTLGDVSSNIGGLLGSGSYNGLVNEKIEYFLPLLINSNQQMISDLMESLIVPRANDFLKGKKLWDVLGSMGNSPSICQPTPAPFLALNQTAALV